MNEKGSIGIKIVIFVLIIALVIGGIFLFRNKGKNSSINYEDLKENYEYFPVYKNNGKVGVIDKSGNMIIDPEYEEVYIPNQEKDVFICFQIENHYRILNKDKAELFQDVSNVEVIMINEDTMEMERGVLRYKTDEKYGLLSLDGEKLTNPIYDSIISMPNKPGDLLVEKDGKFGVLNSLGKEIIPVDYTNIRGDDYVSPKDGYKKTGYILSNKTDEGVLYGYADYDGEIVIPAKYEKVGRCLDYELDDVYIVYMDRGRSGIYRNDKVMIKPEYQEIHFYAPSHVFIVNKNGKFGLINKDGKMVLEPEYLNYSIAGNYIYVATESMSSLFDIHGNLINSNSYRSIKATDNPEYFIAENEKGFYSIISKDKQIDNNYLRIEYAFDNFFIFTDQNGKCGLLNVYTGVEINPDYDSILVIEGTNALEAKTGTVTDIYEKNLVKVLSIENGVIENLKNDNFVVYNNKEMHYFDKLGKEVRNIEILDEKNIYTYSENGKWGYIRKDGAVVVPATYDMATELDDYGFAGVLKNNKWGVVNFEGNVIVEPAYTIENYYFPRFVGEYMLDEIRNNYCIEINVEEAKK